MDTIDHLIRGMEAGLETCAHLDDYTVRLMPFQGSWHLFIDGQHSNGGSHNHVRKLLVEWKAGKRAIVRFERRSLLCVKR